MVPFALRFSVRSLSCPKMKLNECTLLATGTLNAGRGCKPKIRIFDCNFILHFEPAMSALEWKHSSYWWDVEIHVIQPFKHSNCLLLVLGLFRLLSLLWLPLVLGFLFCLLGWNNPFVGSYPSIWWGTLSRDLG